MLRRFSAWTAGLLVSLLAVASCHPSLAADWRQFRGNDTGGTSADPAPTQLGEETKAWRVDLPGRGLASPIVVGDRVYVTACSGASQERLHLLCFAAADGSRLWERQFWATGRTTAHEKTSNAAPTPCSDGQRIFAFFSSNDVVCVDLEGNLQWMRGLTWDYPNASNSLGMSSSPVVAGETVVCMVENDDQSFTVGLNVEDGTERWKIDRPRAANWTSPALWKAAEGEADRVLVQSSKGLVAVEPLTGAAAWEYVDGASTIPSVAYSGGIAFVPSKGITALRPSTSDPHVPEILWQEGALSPGTASPVVAADRVYVVNRGGALAAASTTDGQRVWQLRLTGAFSGSPVIGDGHLYIVNEEGVAQVVKLGSEAGEKVSEFALEETVLSTPALANGALYIRSETGLWKFATK